MNHIILIGFMGAGKTSVGQKLAEYAGLRFVDTDQLIEEQQAKTINDIFAEYGEACFRDLETDILRQLQRSESPLVIAVGGGLPVRAENRRLMRELGEVVYLWADVDTLIGRLAGDTTRPKLRGGDLRGRIESLMQAREALYEEAASFRVSTDRKTVDDVVREIAGFAGYAACSGKVPISLSEKP